MRPEQRHRDRGPGWLGGYSTSATPDPNFLYDLTLFVSRLSPPDRPCRKERTDHSAAGHRVRTRSSTTSRRRGTPWSATPTSTSGLSPRDPAGYPDQIRFQHSSNQQAKDGVLSGNGDVYEIGSGAFRREDRADHRKPPPPVPDTVALRPVAHDRYRISQHPRAAVQQRKCGAEAVNYATDRNELVNRLGGPQMATPTCQLFPRNFPGYEYYCPFDATTARPAATPGPIWSKRRNSSPNQERWGCELPSTWSPI